MTSTTVLRGERMIGNERSIINLDLSISLSIRKYFQTAMISEMDEEREFIIDVNSKDAAQH